MNTAALAEKQNQSKVAVAPTRVAQTRATTNASRIDASIEQGLKKIESELESNLSNSKAREDLSKILNGDEKFYVGTGFNTDSNTVKAIQSLIAVWYLKNQSSINASDKANLLKQFISEYESGSFGWASTQMAKEFQGRTLLKAPGSDSDKMSVSHSKKKGQGDVLHEDGTFGIRSVLGALLSAKGAKGDSIGVLNDLIKEAPTFEVFKRLTKNI